MEDKDEKNLVSNKKYECLLFDLDDTLYPLSSGLGIQITKNIQEYMLQKLALEESEVPDLCYSLYKTYGTTMAGLRAIGFNFDYDDFHSFAHGRLPYNELKPDPSLRSLLLGLPIRKVIFTNADKTHAIRVLSRLGLLDCFESIICFETLNPTNKALPIDDDVFEAKGSKSKTDCSLELPRTPVVCKPSEESFQQVFKIANINPRKTLFFDDNLRNLQAGKRTGLHTVRVGSSHLAEGVDYALESIHNIRESLPELWEAGKVAVKKNQQSKL